MEKHVLIAEARDADVKPKKLRLAGRLPGNVYGKSGSHALTLGKKDVDKLLEQISESTVFYLELAGKQTPVMLAEIQKDPIKGEIIHLALREVDLTQKVTAMIPVQTVGSFNVPGTYFHLVYDEIEAEALPTDLPESFSVDVSTLKAIGDSITFADLAYDRAKVVLKIDDEKLPVVTVNEIVETVEEEKPAETTATTEATATADAEKKDDASA